MDNNLHNQNCIFNQYIQSMTILRGYMTGAPAGVKFLKGAKEDI